MTIEERLAAVERELTHQREMQRLREVNETLTTTRVGMVEDQLAQTEKILPKLRNAMKELEEASIVTGELQARQGGVLKGHGQWLEELTQAQIKTEERFRETGDRIDKLVSAIGELIRGNGSTGRHES